VSNGNASTFDWIGYGQNWLAGNTVGLIWSGRYGGVDPWTKANLAADRAIDIVRSTYGAMSFDEALLQAQAETTSLLRAQNADPSQAGENEDALKTLGDVLIVVAIIGVIYLGAQVFIVGKAWKEALHP